LFVNDQANLGLYFNYDNFKWDNNDEFSNLITHSNEYIHAQSNIQKAMILEFQILNDLPQIITSILAVSQTTEARAHFHSQKALEKIRSLKQTSKLSRLCPISKKEIKIPVRGTRCNHLQCFDVNAWEELNGTNRIYTCPICQSWIIAKQDLILDNDFFQSVTKFENNRTKAAIPNKPDILSGKAVLLRKVGHEMFESIKSLTFEQLEKHILEIEGPIDNNTSRLRIFEIKDDTLIQNDEDFSLVDSGSKLVYQIEPISVSASSLNVVDEVVSSIKSHLPDTEDISKEEKQKNTEEMITERKSQEKIFSPEIASSKNPLKKSLDQKIETSSQKEKENHLNHSKEPQKEKSQEEKTQRDTLIFVPYKEPPKVTPKEKKPKEKTQIENLFDFPLAQQQKEKNNDTQR